MIKKATLSAHGSWEDNLRNEVKVRDLTPFIVDEPERLGGTNAGPNPLEYFLGALSSCTSIVTAMVAKEIGITYDALEFFVDGELDPRGYQGVEGVQTYFETVALEIKIDTKADEEALQQLKEKVEQRCPLFNLLKDAGVAVQSQWNKI
ncbi:OsmC family protein [Virgibacillus soli]|uniref:OsmC family protein n=1 Tax=Paracerasibacillus soli TaxID=480284 RepID=A0ABU5CS30_9BACI|nr:OsmC family protein [Virgibacillus soli]MDY0409170.1 OsmC family protein [Virgibacillus soli]